MTERLYTNVRNFSIYLDQHSNSMRPATLMIELCDSETCVEIYKNTTFNPTPDCAGTLAYEQFIPDDNTSYYFDEVKIWINSTTEDCGACDNNYRIDEFWLEFGDVLKLNNTMPTFWIQTNSTYLCADDNGIALWDYGIETNDTEGDTIYYSVDDNVNTNFYWHIYEEFTSKQTSLLGKVPDYSIQYRPYFFDNGTFFEDFISGTLYSYDYSMDCDPKDCYLRFNYQPILLTTDNIVYYANSTMYWKFYLDHNDAVNITLIGVYKEIFDIKILTNDTHYLGYVDETLIYDSAITEDATTGYYRYPDHEYLKVTADLYESQWNITFKQDNTEDTEMIGLAHGNNTFIGARLRGYDTVIENTRATTATLESYNYQHTITQHVPDWSTTYTSPKSFDKYGDFLVRFYVTDGFHLNNASNYKDIIVSVNPKENCPGEHEIDSSLRESVFIKPGQRFFLFLIKQLGLEEKVHAMFWYGFVITFIMLFFSTGWKFNISLMLTSFLYLFLALWGFGNTVHQVSTGLIFSFSLYGLLRGEF